MDIVLSPETEGLVRERIETRLHEIQASINTYRHYIREKEDALTRVEDETRRLFAVAEQLKAAGFEYRIGSYTDSIYLNVEEKQLTAVYKVLGRLKLDQKSVEDGKNRILRIDLVSVKHPFVYISYLKKLPRPNGKKQPKCKIVRERQRASVSYNLVCDA